MAIRKPAVAGKFYPANDETLSKDIQHYLKQADSEISGDVIGLVAPHAGYMFSGGVAAHAYHLVEGSQYDTVFIISPSHFYTLPHSTVMTEGMYETPLGQIKIDETVASSLVATSDLIIKSETGHIGGQEHALEVQLPFLQVLFGERLRIVPVIMGDQSYKSAVELGNGIAQAARNLKVLVVASSDLSHFHPDDQARKLDKLLIASIESFEAKSLENLISTRKAEACGAGPIMAAMIACQKLGANRAKVVKYATSGEVEYGDRYSVVGYLAAVFTDAREAKMNDEAKTAVTHEVKERLLKLARDAVHACVLGNPAPKLPTDHPLYSQPYGAFVTLTIRNSLRGCIGMIEATKPLAETIVDVAEGAALRDPRFLPVDSSELAKISIEISLLSPLVPSNPEAVEPGKHGILIRKGFHQGLLLPQVAVKYGWDRETFLSQTCMKAGLPTNAWTLEDLELFTFTAEVFGENE